MSHQYSSDVEAAKESTRDRKIQPMSVGSRRVAEYVKERIEKFRLHVPVLQCICSPGLRERHWTQVKWIFARLLPNYCLVSKLINKVSLFPYYSGSILLYIDTDYSFSFPW
ncbi:Dynein heavy chain 3, axonemal [Portunus trituberculatus]|uniref:Dynein heavy chain 3, axonemal n=1 Tax=Portunus trituberculatus TaxID=210409 RepID=A0A5B7JJV3_PORTR|nr:Dynein heavy chain 3, axonemal [Portunus trituberculatus]